ncbi:MAG: type II toxin-antitoxin system RelE/ParE family toxin [bacterium]
MGERDRLRIAIVILDITANPFDGKKLDGKHKDSYSARAWPYRIIYQIYKKELLILMIDCERRDKVYRKR